MFTFKKGIFVGALDEIYEFMNGSVTPYLALFRLQRGNAQRSVLESQVEMGLSDKANTVDNVDVFTWS